MTTKYKGKAMMGRCAPILVGREAVGEALWTMHFPSVQISKYPLAQCSPDGRGYDIEGQKR